MREDIAAYRTLWMSFLLNDHENVRFKKKQLDKRAINVLNSPEIQNAEQLLYETTYNEVTNYIREFISSYDLNSPTISSDIRNLVLRISRAFQYLPDCFRLIECKGDLFPRYTFGVKTIFDSFLRTVSRWYLPTSSDKIYS